MTRQTRVSNASMMSFPEKLGRFSWAMFIPMCLILAISIVVLYSAGGGAWRPFALSQLVKIVLGFGVFFFATFTNIKTWIKSAYVIYAIALIMIILVTVELSQLKNYALPAAMLLVPFLLIVAQPDLGTALSLGMITVGMFYIVGAQKKWFIIAIILGLMAAPLMWFGGLHDYQRDRIITFINPDHDAQGAGYQINQAKIAFGSGGMLGKGYMAGTQSQQSFLPEKQTDFIFTMLGEEFGFVGAFALLMLYTTIILVLFWCAKTCRNRFGQLVCFGFMLNFFIYYFINISMVLGLVPTVGVPLPLMSYGGSSLLSLMFGFGLCQNAHIHKDQQLSAKGS